MNYHLSRQAVLLRGSPLELMATRRLVTVGCLYLCWGYDDDDDDVCPSFLVY